MIILRFYQLPNNNCFPSVCYFSRAKPLVKPTAPGSSFSYICLAIYFFLAFIFRSIKPKNTKIPCCNLFFQRSIYPIYKFTSRPLPILRRRTPKGIATPLTRRVARCCFFCAGSVYIVLLGSPTGSIT